MTEQVGTVLNGSEFHWRWCFRGELGEMDVDHLREFHLFMPPCPCTSIPPNMPFIRLSWLFEATTDLRNLPCLQDMPSAGLIYPSEMVEAHFLSHRWLERDHPDRTGQQMAVALSRTWAFDPTNPMSRAHRTGIWYDFMCLPQHPRSADQQATFEELLPCVILLPSVTHPLIILNGGFEFATRAWCVAEGVAALLYGRGSEVASLTLQLLRYNAITRPNISIRDLLNSKALGFEAGLSKLRYWMQENSQDWLTDRDQLIQEEGRNYMHCIEVVNSAARMLSAMKKGNDLDLDANRLLELAALFHLETTEQTDLLFCMRAMERAVRNYQNTKKS
ncbi:MAG: hypothetical protein IPO69_22205 [Saprospiraceae bacterium]|nr:hypothetical protein [Saprospiraceae bacterium]